MTKARVVSLSELGTADVIQVIDKELPPPGKGEVQIRQTAIGFNFIDIYIFYLIIIIHFFLVDVIVYSYYLLFIIYSL